MIVLGVTVLQVLEVVGLGAVGFLVVALVCAGLLVMLQLVLPSTDSGAEAAGQVSPDPSAGVEELGGEPDA